VANDNLRRYMQQMADMLKGIYADRMKFAGFEDLVLQRGCSHQPAPLPKGRWFSRQRECYRNAYNNVMKDPDKYVYVEGFMLCVIPIQHAWFAPKDDTSLVYDSTVRNGSEYLGIPFELEYVHKIMLKANCYGVMDQPGLHFPLLTGEDDIDKVMYQGRVLSARS